MTNYEKIKTISIDEMAEVVTGCCGGCVMHINCTDIEEGMTCTEYAKQWLESEVEQ